MFKRHSPTIEDEDEDEDEDRKGTKKQKYLVESDKTFDFVLEEFKKDKDKTFDSVLEEFKKDKDVTKFSRFVYDKIKALNYLREHKVEDKVDDEVDEVDEDDEYDEDDRKVSDEIASLTSELHEILDKIRYYHEKESNLLIHKISHYQATQSDQSLHDLLISLQQICTNIEGNLSGYLGGLYPDDSSKKYETQEIDINGPVSHYYLISPDRKKRMRLFGDVHVNTAGCDLPSFIKLENLIENTIKSNPGIIIDIFFETTPYNTVYRLKSEYLPCFLTDTQVYFAHKNCFAPYTLQAKNTCKSEYPNARFHSCDARNFFSDFSDIDKHIPQIEDLITKQIGKIEDKTIADKIRSFKTKYKGDIEEEKNKIYTMDAYLLARLFRSYKAPKRRDFGNVDVSNAIIYAGQAHIDYYLKFLVEELGYTLISSIVNIVKRDKSIEINQCIYLDLPIDDGKPFLPFFDLDPPRFRKTRRHMQNSKQNKKLQNPKSRTKKTVKSRTKKSVKSGTKKSVKSRTKKTVKSGTKKTVKSGTKKTVKSRTKKTVKSRTKKTVKSGTKKTVKSGTKKTIKSGHI
jgi:hypothetical protein